MKPLLTTLLAALMALGVVHASKTDGIVVQSATTTQYFTVCKNPACSNTAGTINAFPTGASTTVGSTTRISDTAISGYWYGEELGYINLGATKGNLRIDKVTGRLTGYAWSTMGSWINFSPSALTFSTATVNSPVYISDTGEFRGYAYASGNYGGWIKFDCSDASGDAACLVTDWRRLALREKCQNGIDDDGDNLIDQADPACFGKPLLDDETDPNPGSGLAIFDNPGQSTLSVFYTFADAIRASIIDKPYLFAREIESTLSSYVSGQPDTQSRFVQNYLSVTKSFADRLLAREQSDMLARTLPRSADGTGQNPSTSATNPSEDAGSIFDRMQAAESYVYNALGGQRTATRPSVIAVVPPPAAISPNQLQPPVDVPKSGYVVTPAVPLLPPVKPGSSPIPTKTPGNGTPTTPPSSSSVEQNTPSKTPAVRPTTAQQAQSQRDDTRQDLRVLDPRKNPVALPPAENAVGSEMTSFAAEDGQVITSKSIVIDGVSTSIVEVPTDEVVTIQVVSPNKRPVKSESAVVDRKIVDKQNLLSPFIQTRTLVETILEVISSFVRSLTQSLKNPVSLIFTHAYAEGTEPVSSIDRNPDGSYGVRVSMPQVPGLYNVQLRTTYEDGSVSLATKTILVKERGYVFSSPYSLVRVPSMIVGARIDVEKKNGDIYAPVVRSSVFTMRDGKYSLLLTQGVYRLVVSHPDFTTFVTPDVTVTDAYQVVNIPIEVVCDDGNFFGCSRDIKVIAIVAILYFLKRRKDIASNCDSCESGSCEVHKEKKHIKKSHK